MIASVGEPDRGSPSPLPMRAASFLRPNGLAGKAVGSTAPCLIIPPLPAGGETWENPLIGVLKLLLAELGSDPPDADPPALPCVSPPGFIAPDQSSRAEGGLQNLTRHSEQSLGGTLISAWSRFPDAVQWRCGNCRRFRVSRQHPIDSRGPL